MLLLTAGNRWLCDGLSRREVLHVGGAGLIGLSLPGFLRAATNSGAKAKSLILFFLEGGLAHQDLWDMKPDASEETLVVAMGEFGRTPRVGQITRSAGADRGGPDHWPHCYTVLFAGGGLPGGAIFGASDAHAAYPARDPVTPPDIAATVYRALGIDPSTMIRDPLDRPHLIATSRPIEALLGG